MVETVDTALYAELQTILDSFGQPDLQKDFELYREAIRVLAKFPTTSRDGTAQKIATAMREYGISKTDIINEVKRKQKSLAGVIRGSGDYAGYCTPEQEYGTKPASNGEAVPDGVLHLFANNRFLDLVRKNVEKFHVGDWNVTELLALSVASLSIENTNGLQPKLSGESGKGKTHAAKTMLHLIHPTMRRVTSFSSKALFYDKTLRSKMIIFSDDVNLPPDTEEMVRAAMSNWDAPTQHTTVDQQRKPVTLTLPPRITFWLTSVKTNSTLQLLNRQVEMNVDESAEQDWLVAEHQRRSSEDGLAEFYEDEEVELLREAFLHLNQIHCKVKIPFAHNIRFSCVSNRRNLPIFLDLVKAYCILNYKARMTDENGSLIAEKEDFDYASELFETIAVQQVTKLDGKERRIATIIKQNAPCDIDTISDEIELSPSYIYEIIHGVKKSGNRGLREKIPQLRFFSRHDTNPQTGQRWGKNHYSLPDDWELLDNHESVVSWAHESEAPKQLRSPSHSFEKELRSEEKLYATSDNRKSSFKPKYAWYGDLYRYFEEN
jgi:hypothetical protein